MDRLWDRFNSWQWSGCVWVIVVLFGLSWAERACSTEGDPQITPSGVVTFAPEGGALGLLHQSYSETARANSTELAAGLVDCGT